MAVKMNRIGWLTSVALVGLLALPVFSQTDNGGGGNNNNQNNNNNAGPGGGGPGGGPGGGQGNGGPGGGGGGRRFDPAQFRQRMMQRLQTALGASDDEFAVLEPKIDAVVQLRMDVNGGGFGRGMGGRRPGGQDGGGGAPPSTQPSTPVQAAIQDLRTTLDDDSATPDQIKSKLDTLRQARAQEKTDLSKSEDDLRSLLTQRQEAQLVLFGILD
jgi:hypothetical protein